MTRSSHPRATRSRVYLLGLVAVLLVAALLVIDAGRGSGVEGSPRMRDEERGTAPPSLGAGSLLEPPARRVAEPRPPDSGPARPTDVPQASEDCPSLPELLLAFGWVPGELGSSGALADPARERARILSALEGMDPTNEGPHAQELKVLVPMLEGLGLGTAAEAERLFRWADREASQLWARHVVGALISQGDEGTSLALDLVDSHWRRYLTGSREVVGYVSTSLALRRIADAGIASAAPRMIAIARQAAEEWWVAATGEEGERFRERPGRRAASPPGGRARILLEGP